MMTDWNPEHLERLVAGVEGWNRWRRENPDIRPDLESARLAGTNLAGANLNYVSLLTTDLRGANLTSAELRSASLETARLVGAILVDADCQDAKFDLARLTDARLEGANLSSAAFTGSDLRGACLRAANLSSAHFDRSDLQGADLRESNLWATLFHRADLAGADMTRAKFGTTVLASVDLSSVYGLDTAAHTSPSTIGVDTLLQSKGQIPEAFLRGTGLTDAMGAFAREQQHAVYPPCFISYSSRDEVFAEKLYTDLQSAGVRCWFAPEDMKIGEPIRQRIHESIGAHEKLIVILSAASLASEWVESEVETAFEKEKTTGKTVLFPVRIDDGAIESDAAWAVTLRRRHIGDFREWGTPEKYAVSVERFLRDLRSRRE